MEKISHPVSGEEGYFATETEKKLINVILLNFLINQHDRSDVGGVGLE